MSVGPAAVLAAPAVTGTRRYKAARQLARRPAAIAALAVVLGFIVAAVAAPRLAPYDPNAIHYRALRKPTSAAHRLGTDEVGATCCRACLGARASLLTGVIPVAIGVALSVPLGRSRALSAGDRRAYSASTTPCSRSRSSSWRSRWPRSSARASQRHYRDRVVASRCSSGSCGAPCWRSRPGVRGGGAGAGPLQPRVALRHILPNTLPPLFVQVSITVAAAIIAEASLSFLGLGQQPPAPSWGSMLNAAQRYLGPAPWMALYPGLMIFGIVMALNVLGDGLRDVLDPRHQ